MRFRDLPYPLRLYLLAHTLVLAPFVYAGGFWARPDSPTLTGTLALCAVLLSTWKLELSVFHGRITPTFAVVCLAVLLQGGQAAVLCAVAGAVVTSVVRAKDSLWNLKFLRPPFYRVWFNVANCALACLTGALAFQAVVANVGDPSWAEVLGLVAFTSVYFAVNSIGLALAIGFERQMSWVAVWREKVLWTAFGFLASASAAGAIRLAFDLMGVRALFLLPLLAFSFYWYQLYLDRSRVGRVNRELAAIQRELMEKNEELKRLNNLKTQFLGIAAHDLRTPLGVIQNLSYMMLEAEERLTPAKRADMIRRIQSSSRYMLQLVNDFLEVSRIEAGGLTLELRPTDLLALARDCVTVNTYLAGNKNISLELAEESEPVEVMADPAKMEQVVNNLISNAIKFSHAGRTVRVSVTRDGGVGVLCVQDEGQGIPPEEREKLFEFFQQTSVKSTGGERGAGLGLAIVDKIVSGHGGAIRVESEVGVGSAFFVSLPLATAPVEVGAPS